MCTVEPTNSIQEENYCGYNVNSSSLFVGGRVDGFWFGNPLADLRLPPPLFSLGLIVRIWSEAPGWRGQMGLFSPSGNTRVRISQSSAEFSTALTLEPSHGAHGDCAMTTLIQHPSAQATAPRGGYKPHTHTNTRTHAHTHTHTSADSQLWSCEVKTQ